MTTLNFLQTMYGGATSGYLSVWTLPDKKTAFFPTGELDKAVTYAEALFDTHDVYFGVGLRGEALGENQRGGSDNVSVITAFWSDIDIRGPAHRETELPETADEATEFLRALPLEPSVVVDSGNGLHVYWIFAEPLTVMTDAHRKNIGDALRGWQTHINSAARERGWKLDNTSDLARVLRLPGGINHKLGNDRRAEVISVSDHRYLPSDFAPYIPAPVSDIGTASGASDRIEFNAEVGAAERVIAKCAFMRYCRDNAATLPEPYWYAMTSNLALCTDGKAICHEFSKAYPKYDAAETGAKIEHARKSAKPHTCAYIRGTLGYDCGCCAAGCRAPVALAIFTKADAARELLEKSIPDYGAVFSDEYIDALGYAKAKLPGEYAQFKQKHKGKISVRDIEKCIRDYEARQRRSGGGAPVGEALAFEDIDLNGAVVPRKWQVSERGVRRHAETKSGTEEIIVCPDPVVITRRLVNIDNEKERLEISFRRDGRWKSVVGGRTQVYNKASILSFGDEGLHVTSGTASELVSYLSDYETANKVVIPRVSSIGRLGWIDTHTGTGDTQFFPYSTDDEIMFEEDKGTAALYRNLTERGDYAAWKAMMKELRRNPIARFITSASFASPLLCKIGVRTFVIHLWHMSASGKSAALKAAISVWGNPLRITMVLRQW